MKYSNLTLLFVLSLLTLLLFWAELTVGPVSLDVATLLDEWRSAEFGLQSIVFYEIRLPRALIAMSVGAVLGLSGAAMQGILRNPLAEPGVMGISSCAALGAVIALYFGFANHSWWMLSLFGVGGSLISVLLLFALAGRRSSQLALILSGVALNAVAASLIAVALNFAPNPYAISEIVYWLMGSFLNRTMSEFWLALPLFFIGTGIIFWRSPVLGALSFGEETAISLGFNVHREKRWLISGIALVVGAAVSVSGAIGFVGLVVPHLMRPLVKSHPRKLLWISTLAGAAFMLLADLTVQLISPSMEIKIGVITSLVGGPFFFYLIYRLRSVSV